VRRRCARFAAGAGVAGLRPRTWSACGAAPTRCSRCTRLPARARRPLASRCRRDWQPASRRTAEDL
jgi:hypothetical protein